MKYRILNRIIILFTIIIFVGCSSTTRYARSINENNKRNEVRNSEYLEIETGIASYYADEFNGRKTASGEIYDMYDLTAVHPTYPFNTIVKVTNLQNEKSVEVRINDRMPQFKNRVIDLSFAAAKRIEMLNAGIQEVKIEVISFGD